MCDRTNLDPCPRSTPSTCAAPSALCCWPTGPLEDQIRPCGIQLSLPQATALIALGASPHGLGITELSAQLRIDRSNVSRLCGRLAARGLCELGADPADGRARRVRLTDAGQAEAARVDAASQRYHAALLRALGPDAPQVVAALGRLASAIATLDPIDPESP